VLAGDDAMSSAAASERHAKRMAGSWL